MEADKRQPMRHGRSSQSNAIIVTAHWPADKDKRTGEADLHAVVLSLEACLLILQAVQALLLGLRTPHNRKSHPEEGNMHCHAGPPDGASMPIGTMMCPSVDVLGFTVCTVRFA